MVTQVRRMDLRMIRDTNDQCKVIDMVNVDGSTDHWTRFIFHEYGTVCLGDSQLDCMTYGTQYGYGWFSKGPMDCDYLAEKFLKKKDEWCPSAFADCVSEWISERWRDWDGETTDTATLLATTARICREAQDGEADASMTYNAMVEAGWDMDGLPGYYYDRARAGWLTAFQNRFAELTADYKHE